jgi:hypothetical protein
LEQHRHIDRVIDASLVRRPHCCFNHSAGSHGLAHVDVEGQLAEDHWSGMTEQQRDRQGEAACSQGKNQLYFFAVVVFNKPHRLD